MSNAAHGVAWQEWGDEAFAQARREDKPILLDIGAVWCHWCHVMDDGIAGDPDHTGTYANAAVQERIASGFVAIKVDNDKRPDINARYNMGGWPTTAFLTPNGETLYGETYVPPRRMVALLDHIQSLWHDKRADVDAQLAEMRRERDAQPPVPLAEGLDAGAVPFVINALHGAWDDAFGGFVSGSQLAPKFPHPAALLLLLEHSARTNDPTVREMAVSTLRGMGEGGMYDHFAGGWFRYSTTRDWSVPHYEKMLEDNAKLISVCVRASHVFPDLPEFLAIARHAQAWMLSDLRDAATGAFAGSQDADAEEAFYGQPLNVRATLPTPYIDRTVYCDWNALAVSSLVARYQATREQPILEAAAKAYGFLQTHLFDAAHGSESAGALHHFFADSRAQGTVGLLGDQVAFVSAALDLAEVTGEGRYLSEAISTADFLVTHLQDTNQGGFYDLPPDPHALGELARPKKEMDDNSDAALALRRLSALTGDDKYRVAGERALRVFAGEYQQMSFFAASYARAVDAYLRPSVHLIVVGPPGSAPFDEMQQRVWLAPLSGRAVETLGGERATERGFPPSGDGAARAYVCIGMACHVANTVEELRLLLAQAGNAHFPAETGL